MEDMIARIVEMDKKARDMTEQAQQSKLDHENRIIAKRESIKAELLERAKKRIAINEKTAVQKAEKERRQIEERDSAMIEKLESEYKSHCDEWVDTIVARVVGE